VTENSAEREAEKILKEAAQKIQTEQCPQGEDCAIHHRVDEEYVQEEIKYARYITYSGEYVVITEDNHIFETPRFLLKVLLGEVKEEADLPPRWETSIFHVGSGTVGDLSRRSLTDRGNALRYAKTHDDWDQLKGIHDVTVLALREGMIDVSTPLNED